MNNVPTAAEILQKIRQGMKYRLPQDRAPDTRQTLEDLLSDKSENENLIFLDWACTYNRCTSNEC